MKKENEQEHNEASCSPCVPSYSVCVKWAACLTTTRHHFEGADKPA